MDELSARRQRSRPRASVRVRQLEDPACGGAVEPTRADELFETTGEIDPGDLELEHTHRKGGAAAAAQDGVQRKGVAGGGEREPKRHDAKDEVAAVEDQRLARDEERNGNECQDAGQPGAVAYGEPQGGYETEQPQRVLPAMVGWRRRAPRSRAAA